MSIAGEIRARTKGASLVEYGMLAGMVAVMAIGGASLVGSTGVDVYCGSSEAMADVRGATLEDCAAVADSGAVAVTPDGVSSPYEVDNSSTLLAQMNLLSYPPEGGLVDYRSADLSFGPDYVALNGEYANLYDLNQGIPSRMASGSVQVFNSTAPLPEGVDLVDKPQNLDKVNWLINQGFDDVFSHTDISSAIYALVDDMGGLDADRRTAGVQLTPDAQAVYDAAMASGQGFVPSAENGDLVGMVIRPVSDDEAGGYVSDGAVQIVGMPAP